MYHAGESYMDLFASVSVQATINVNGQMIILNHNPFLCFGGAYKDTWQLFGHVHSGPNSPRNGLDESRLKYLFPTQYDVEVDHNDYKPITYAQVRAKIQEQIKNQVDNVKFKNAVDYDIVHEIINTMFCETIKKRNSCVDPAERGSLEAEIEIFRDELKLLNSGTEKDFERLSEKAYNVYSPLIRSQNEEADKGSL